MSLTHTYAHPPPHAYTHIHTHTPSILETESCYNCQCLGATVFLPPLVCCGSRLAPACLVLLASCYRMLSFTLSSSCLSLLSYYTTPAVFTYVHGRVFVVCFHPFSFNLCVLQSETCLFYTTYGWAMFSISVSIFAVSLSFHGVEVHET